MGEVVVAVEIGVSFVLEGVEVDKALGFNKGAFATTHFGFGGKPRLSRGAFYQRRS